MIEIALFQIWTHTQKRLIQNKRTCNPKFIHICTWKHMKNRHVWWEKNIFPSILKWNSSHIIILNEWKYQAKEKGLGSKNKYIQVELSLMYAHYLFIYLYKQAWTANRIIGIFLLFLRLSIVCLLSEFDAFG